MENVLVKVEFDSNLCSGCLASNRNLKPVGKYLDLYQCILGKNYDNDSKTKEVILCWECIAMLKRLTSFQERVKHAHFLLTELYCQDNVPSLTTLACISKDYYDSIFEYGTDVLTFDECTSKSTVKDESLLKDIKKEAVSKDMSVNEDFIETTSNLEGDSNSIGVDTNETDTKEEVINPRKKKKCQSNPLYKDRFKDLAIVEPINWKKKEYYCTNITLEECQIEKLLNETDRKEYSYESSTFKCEICKLGYNKLDDLKRHLNLNHDESDDGTYTCRVCEKILNTKETLNVHWREHSVYMRCNKCGYLCPSAPEFSKHLRKLHLKTVQCMLCSATYGTFDEFKKHFSDAHIGYTCDYCGKQFKMKNTLIQHIAKHNTPLPTKCKECGKQLKNHARMKAHVRLMHSVSGTELRYCVECDRQFPTVGRYRQHLRSSTRHNAAARPQGQSCPECGKKFTRKDFMRNHYDKVHLKVTKHHCGVCNKYYSTAFSLRLHLMRIHQKLEPYKRKIKICDFCGQGFTTNKALRQHSVMHTSQLVPLLPYNI